MSELLGDTTLLLEPPIRYSIGPSPLTSSSEMIPEPGEGVFAKCFIEGGENCVLFRQRPLVALQTIQTKADVYACSKCFRFLGAPLDSGSPEEV